MLENILRKHKVTFDCVTKRFLVPLGLLNIGCDHSRAHQLMLASVTNTCLVAARSCADGDEFEKDVRDYTAKTAQDLAKIIVLTCT